MPGGPPQLAGQTGAPVVCCLARCRAGADQRATSAASCWGTSAELRRHLLPQQPAEEVVRGRVCAQAHEAGPAGRERCCRWRRSRSPTSAWAHMQLPAVLTRGRHPDPQTSCCSGEGSTHMLAGAAGLLAVLQSSRLLLACPAGSGAGLSGPGCCRLPSAAAEAAPARGAADEDAPPGPGVRQHDGRAGGSVARHGQPVPVRQHVRGAVPLLHLRALLRRSPDQPANGGALPAGTTVAADRPALPQGPPQGQDCAVERKEWLLRL